MSRVPQSTADLLAFAGGAHRLSGTVRSDAIRFLGDTLAIGAAAVGAPGEEAILDTARTFGQGAEARLWGTPERLPAASGAFVNAFRAHCLEWDGVHEPAVVHAMSVVTAALGAVLDRRAAGGHPCDPEEALIALAVGVDVASGLGLSVDSPMRFFRPAVCGLMGAALAVARIEGAPLDDALGLAYSSAAGTMQAHVEGSVTLPFQIANAARAAVTASDLAKSGFSAPKNPLEGPYGYYELFESGALETYTRHLGDVWRISELSTKPFPSGRASHALIAGVQELGLTPNNLEALEIRVPPLVHRLISRPYRSDMAPSYARLCGQLLCALTIRDGLVDPRKFTPETFADPGLCDLAGKINIQRDANSDPNALSPQRISARLEDGAVELDIPHTLGSPDNPLTPAQTQAKIALARALAPPDADVRIFENPLAYFTELQ